MNASARHSSRRAAALVLALATFSAVADTATNAPAADPAAMVGARAVIAAALRPEPKPAAETNSWDRFLLAARALGDRQVEARGAVAPADWLAALDLALAADPEAERTIPASEGPAFGNESRPTVRAAMTALLSLLPGPEGWDEVRAGLRVRATKPATGAAAAADGAEARDGKRKPDARPILLAALQAAADFLGEGGRGAPASLEKLAALPLPEGVSTNRAAKAVAALRRAMEDPGVPRRQPFSAERLLRQIERARRGSEKDVSLPKELADLPDEAFAPIAQRLFAPAEEGDSDDWFEYHVRLCDVPSNVVTRLVAAAAATTNAGPMAWALATDSSVVAQAGPETHALFASLVAAQDPLASIRRRVADVRAARAERKAEGAEEDMEVDGDEDNDDPASFFTWEDRGKPMGRYAEAFSLLLAADLDANRLSNAEALAAPLGPDDWPAVLGLAGECYRTLSVGRPTDAWRAFLEARLPAGGALLRSPLLRCYAEACLPDQAERFERTCARLLGEEAGSDKAKKALKDWRLDFARASGDLDALEADFLERTDPASKDASLSGADGWCRALEAMGETNRLARALDRVLALAETPLPDGSRREAPVWAVPILARAGRFGQAEAVARAAMADDVEKSRRGEHVYRYGSSGGDPATALLRAYVEAGRPDEALALAAGWPRWKSVSIGARDARGDRTSLAATLARALAEAGGETNAAAAAAIARAAAGDGTTRDWPFEILLGAMPGADFRALLDDLSRLDPYEERPWQWKAESLRREGDLAGAEAAARRALEIDPTDGESAAGDRVRSYSILASVLEDKGGESDRSEAATLRRVVAAVRAAEKGDELTERGYLAGAIARYDEAAALFSDAYCVQWRLAERLRMAGREAEAVAHYEETFRHMPAQFGQVASLCFGCEGVFSSDASVGAAGRILPALAAAPGAGASVHYLLGTLREHQKRYDEAYAAFSRALEVDPGHFDALKALFGLRDEVERPAADWARLQARARTLDPFCANHREDASRIVDWPGLWRAWDGAAAGAPAPWKAPKGPLFRFEAAARIADAAAAARRAAESEIAREAGAEDEPEEEGTDAGRKESGGNAGYLPARMLVRGDGRFWASRLVDLASALAADPRGGGSNRRFLCYDSSSRFALSAGSSDAWGDDEDYFWDE